MKMTKLIAIGCAVLLGVGLVATQARADIVYYELDKGNGGNGLPISPATPYAEVKVDLTFGANTDTAVITFTALSGYEIKQENAAAVNVNATSWNVAVPNGSTYKDNGSQYPNVWGSFNQTFTHIAGKPNSNLTSLQFTLTDKSGTWANASSVLTANENGYVAAAHIYSESSGKTGYAATQGPPRTTSVVPIPGSFYLLGSGVICLIGLKRKYLG